MVNLAKKRAVLLEVRSLLQTNKIFPTRGVYFETNYEVDKQLVKARKNGLGLREVIQQDWFECEVCAMGSLLVGYASAFNEIPATDYYSRDDIRRALSGVFTETELYAMEEDFESHVRADADEILLGIIEEKLAEIPVTEVWVNSSETPLF